MIDNFWVSVGGFSFKPSHIVFALQNWEALHLWRWPPDPNSTSGYDIEPESMKARRFRPPFWERIIDITASIEMYAEELGRDGDILLTRFSDNYRDDHSCDNLAIQLGMPTEEVRERVKTALFYISARARGLK